MVLFLHITLALSLQAIAVLIALILVPILPYPTLSYQVLREERGDSEVEYLDKLRLMEEKHQNEMQDAEATFQLKIMQLVDGYQELIRMRDAQIERLEDQRRILVLSHERYVEEVTKDFEQRLEDDRRARIRQEEAKTECSRELTEMEQQLEVQARSYLHYTRT